MFCKNCGKELENGVNFCPYCGARQTAEQEVYQEFPNANQGTGYQGTATQSPRTAEPDAPSMGFAVLGFFFPLVGLILWLCMMNTTPLRAKSAGKGALVGVIVQVVLSLLSTALLVALFFWYEQNYGGYPI